MADTKSIALLQDLHPKCRQQALDAYYEAVKETPAGVHPFIVETLRSFERSNYLYAQGRTKSGDIVTNAKAGQSYHNYGLAIDFCLMIDGKMSYKVDANWNVVVNIFKKHGFAWGGDFKSIKDYPHFEMTFGYNWRSLLSKHNAKDFIPGTNYVNI